MGKKSVRNKPKNPYFQYTPPSNSALVWVSYNFHHSTAGSRVRDTSPTLPESESSIPSMTSFSLETEASRLREISRCLAAKSFSISVSSRLTSPRSSPLSLRSGPVSSGTSPLSPGTSSAGIPQVSSDSSSSSTDSLLPEKQRRHPHFLTGSYTSRIHSLKSVALVFATVKERAVFNQSSSDFSGKRFCFFLCYINSEI